MGNSQSPPTDPAYDSASRAFTQRELQDLRTLFKSLAAQSQSNGRYISPFVFQAYFGLQAPLADRMFDLVTRKRKDQRMTFQDLVVAKGTYEKGTKEDIEEFIFQLLDVSGDDIVERSDLESVLVAIIKGVFCLKDSEAGLSSHQNSANIFLSVATFSKCDERCSDKSMSLDDFRNWCALIPSIRKSLGNLLMSPDSGRPGYQVPHLLHSENVDSNMILLSKEYAWHIGGALTQQELEEWRLLYHSAVNGLSFNTFLGHITQDIGSTVLIIKDQEGYIYGGYASQPWERHADFYGDMKSFLFQLYPKASIFRPTGANNNLQWCAVNFSSDDIPNGIGFGGRVHHFGLFLSASFDQGHTFSCTTFGSPCLSENSRICPEVIECWGVCQKASQQLGGNGAARGTILERYKEDRNMLKMVGLANSSD